MPCTSMRSTVRGETHQQPRGRHGTRGEERRAYIESRDVRWHVWRVKVATVDSISDSGGDGDSDDMQE